jgi:hypothetical protein
MDAPLVPLPRVISRGDARDQRAELRDRAAEARDRAAALSPGDTAESAQSRRASHVDRVHAGRDRDEAAADRADIIEWLSVGERLERASGISRRSRARTEQSRGLIGSSRELLDEAGRRMQKPMSEA